MRRKRPALLLYPILVAWLLMPGLSPAFHQADLERVKALYRCPGCNLTDADLTGVNLAYADLRKADLSRANLAGVQLGQANLTDADLTGANLTGAKFYMADLTGANLTGANLTGAKFYNAILSNTNLSEANLSEALWIDGTKCRAGSVGECVKEEKK